MILDHVIQSDTDSLYIGFEPLLRKRYPDLDFNNDEEVIPKLRAICKEFQDDLNDWYPSFAKERFNSTNNRLKIKSETIGKRLYVSAKKQYAQYIVDKEGVKPKDPFDFKGLDFMKSSFPLLFRTFTQDIVKDILFDKPKSKIDNDILDFRDKFKTLDLKDVAKPTGVNKDFKDYIKSYPKQGRIFSVIASGTGAHIKAAIFYNDLLRFKKLDKEYSVLQIGDKVRWMYLKDNPYKIEVLAFPLYDYAPEILEFIQTYMDREEMWNSILVKKLQKIYDNLHWGEINFNKNTKKFFRYEK